MIPFIIDEGELPFSNLDYIFLPEIRKSLADNKTEFEAYVVKDGELHPFTLRMGELTPDEKDIILKGCLINYYRG
jgi:aconitate hydratase